MNRKIPARVHGLPMLNAVTFILLGLAPALSAQEFKVFISADMEGVAGVVAGNQTGSEGSDYGYFRAQMTAEVNAAIAAAFDAGASEVVVTDAHGSGTNLLPGDVDKRAVLISGFPMPGGMVTGLDESFAAAILIGVHAHGSTQNAILAHTYIGALKHVRLNGVEVGEPGLNAAMAGHFGVPVVFVSGDAAAVAELRSLVPKVESVAVKEAVGITAARLMSPESAREKIALGVSSGLARRNEIPPVAIAKPVTLEVELAEIGQADNVALLPGMSRVGGRVVRYEAPDMGAAYRISILVEKLATAK
jgi:D-amino peptidase